MGDDTSSPLNNVITIVLKRSWAGEVRNVSLLVAIGVNSDGYREIVPIIDAPPTTVGRACPVSERCGNRPTTTQDRQ